MFVIARGAAGRPTLIHRCEVIGADRTDCGVSMYGWSREYMAKPLWEILRCRQKGCR